MKTPCLFAIAVLVSSTVSSNAIAQQSKLRNVKLYAPNKHKHDQSRAYYDFGHKRLAARGERWDLGYGRLNVNDDPDWFLSSYPSRSVVKDLGRYDWTDQFTAQAIAPLPALQTWPMRVMVIDASGSGRANGTQRLSVEEGAANDAGIEDVSDRTRYADTKGSARPMRASSERIVPTPRPTSRSMVPRSTDGARTVTKAVPGHIYEMRVVDEKRDFYILFRVDELTPGDNCKISWRQVAAPH
jgi:hypothetical protein